MVTAVSTVRDALDPPDPPIPNTYRHAAAKPV
jgi:hypothetical protein